MSGDRVADGAAHVRCEITDGVAVVTLDRPDVLNAFSSRMGRELEAAFTECDTRDDVRVVVLTGAGRAFCSGADLSSGGDTFGAPDRSTFRSDPFTVHAWDVRKPVIAAVNGHAVGLGLTLALQTDIRIVAAEAKCGVVQVRRGVMPDLRAHWTLTRAVGQARAAEILLTGRMFTGSELAAMGVMSRALPAAAVLPAALDLARDVATNTAPVSVAVSKALLWADPTPSGAETDRLERDLHLRLMGTPDAREGAVAFLERRDPRWVGSVTRDWPADLLDGWGPDAGDPAG